MTRFSISARLGAAVFLALSFATSALAQTSAARWFPLQQGNQWTFDDGNGVTTTIVCDEESGSWRHVTGLLGGDRWLRYGGSLPANLYAWNADASALERLFRFDAGDGTSWTLALSSNPCDALIATAGGVENVSTPAGDFAGCKKFALTPSCGGVGSTVVWLALDVGPVRIQTSSGATLALTGATVGSTTYPQAPPAGGTTGGSTGGGASRGMDVFTSPATSDFTVAEGASLSFPITATDSSGSPVRVTYVGNSEGTDLGLYFGASFDSGTGAFTWPVPLHVQLAGQTFHLQFVSSARGTSGVISSPYSTWKEVVIHIVAAPATPAGAWRAFLPQGAVKMKSYVTFTAHEHATMASGTTDKDMAYGVEIRIEGSNPGTIAIIATDSTDVPGTLNDADGTFQVVGGDGVTYSLGINGYIQPDGTIVVTGYSSLTTSSWASRSVGIVSGPASGQLR
jgi:hypothetical protein